VPEKAAQHSSDQKLKPEENPFLPKHIRERLSGTVDIPAYAKADEVIRSPYVAPDFSYDDRSTELKANEKPQTFSLSAAKTY